MDWTQCEAFHSLLWKVSESLCSPHILSGETHLKFEILIQTFRRWQVSSSGLVPKLHENSKPELSGETVKQTALYCRAQRSRSWKYGMSPMDLTSQQWWDSESEYRFNWAVAVTMSMETRFVPKKYHSIVFLCNVLFTQGEWGARFSLNLNYPQSSWKCWKLDVILI